MSVEPCVSLIVPSYGSVPRRCSLLGRVPRSGSPRLCSYAALRLLDARPGSLSLAEVVPARCRSTELSQGSWMTLSYVPRSWIPEGRCAEARALRMAHRCCLRRPQTSRPAHFSSIGTYRAAEPIAVYASRSRSPVYSSRPRKTRYPCGGLRPSRSGLSPVGHDSKFQVLPPFTLTRLHLARCGEQKDGCEPRMVDLVSRGAGHQTSLFSIRPPEVLRESSLEDSWMRHSSASPCIGGERARTCLPGHAAAPTIRIGLWHLDGDRHSDPMGPGFMSSIIYVCRYTYTISGSLKPDCNHRM